MRLPHFGSSLWAAATLSVVLTGTAYAQDRDITPPADDPRREYDAPGFTGIDEGALRRELQLSANLYVAAAMADFGTTQYALSLGGKEANPLIRHRGLVAPIKVAAVLVTLEVEEWLRRSGSNTWANVVRWGFVVLNVGAAVWNITKVP